MLKKRTRGSSWPRRKDDLGKGVGAQSLRNDERAYLIFVIFFTLAKFLENKIYTKKRQFFALNL